jgi:Domain of unknown function (DUF4349)
MKKFIIFISICLAMGCKKAKESNRTSATADMKEISQNAPPQSAPVAETAELVQEKTGALSGSTTVIANRIASSVAANAQSATVLDAAPIKHIIFPTSTYSTPIRKIVRTAQVKSKVDNTEQATYRIEQMARKFNGFVMQTNLESRNLEKTETPVSQDSILEITQFEVGNTIALRVPNVHLDTFLTELSRVYTHLDFRRTNAEDLTAGFLTNQLKAQLRDNSAQRIAQASDEKGKRLADIVGAEETRVSMKDAAIEQQIQNLETDYDIAYSVVNVEIYQNAVVSRTMKSASGSLTASANFGFRLTQALTNGWSILLEVFLFVLNLWAFILLGFCLFLGYKKIKTLNFLPLKS